MTQEQLVWSFFTKHETMGTASGMTIEGNRLYSTLSGQRKSHPRRADRAVPFDGRIVLAARGDFGFGVQYLANSGGASGSRSALAKQQGLVTDAARSLLPEKVQHLNFDLLEAIAPDFLDCIQLDKIFDHKVVKVETAWQGGRNLRQQVTRIHQRRLLYVANKPYLYDISQFKAGMTQTAHRQIDPADRFFPLDEEALAELYILGEDFDEARSETRRIRNARRLEISEAVMVAQHPLPRVAVKYPSGRWAFCDIPEKKDPDEYEAREEIVKLLASVARGQRHVRNVEVHDLETGKRYYPHVRLELSINEEPPDEDDIFENLSLRKL